MCQSKNIATLPDAGPANPPGANPYARSVSDEHTPGVARIKPVPIGNLPQEVQDVLVAARKLYTETPRRVLGLFAALAALIPGPVQADELVACFYEAGGRYGIAPALLRAIAEMKSRLDPQAIHINADETADIRLMQINSWWFPVLEQHGIEPRDLWDPCLSIGVGVGVGAYNAGTRRDQTTGRRREDYAIRVYRYLLCGAGRLCIDTAQPE